jgi:dipeptidyl aminopeptidase/acylaminoacyl peptidase
VEGKRALEDLSVARDGRVAVTSSTPDRPTEVFAVEGRELRRLTGQNDAWLAQVRLASLEEISFKSKDGTPIHGFVLKPTDYSPGTRYPTLLRIHGGPVWQFYHDFANLDWQVFAARGYVVVGVNPRGSSGRGEKFSTAIFAAWGEKDGDDVLAAVDYLVERGIADPDRLGIGGWSYGGMLTNQVIARDRRFKAATSGAGQGNALIGYGTDMYTLEYELELGKPWSDPKAWQRVSQPFFRADRIVTPTLFLCGQEDWNVPLINSEQMYQALKSLGRKTELVIYPGESHGITRPSFVLDRMERYLAWYDEHLGAPAAAASTGGG